MTTLQQNKRVFAALTVAVSFSAIAFLSNSRRADAAIITVSDVGSWINGTNTIADQGFNLIPVPDSSEALFSDLSKLSSPLGDIEFTNSVNKREIGKGWRTWSNGYTGEVYFSGIDVLTLDLKLPNLSAFDFYIQPDLQDEIATIFVIAQSGNTSEVLTQDVNGLGGAKYFGFYSDDPLDPIQSVQISGPDSGGFAIGQLRGAKTATVPTPFLLPGMIGLGLGLWRKARNRQSEN